MSTNVPAYVMLLPTHESCSGSRTGQGRVSAARTPARIHGCRRSRQSQAASPLVLKHGLSL
jgi:hypothetical protein